LGLSQNFTDTVWIVGPLGQAISIKSIFYIVGGESEHSMGSTASPYHGRIFSNWWAGRSTQSARDTRQKTSRKHGGCIKPLMK
jgi:hypothetical protein